MKPGRGLPRDAQAILLVVGVVPLLFTVACQRDRPPSTKTLQQLPEKPGPPQATSEQRVSIKDAIVGKPEASAPTDARFSQTGRGCAPDEQVQRDADPKLNEWRNFGAGVGDAVANFRLETPGFTKTPDQYEKDKCVVVAEADVLNAAVKGMPKGTKVVLSLTYQREADFWKLAGSKNTINGFSVAAYRSSYVYMRSMCGTQCANREAYTAMRAAAAGY